MKELALIICSKRPYRTLEDFALTLAEIPPILTYHPKQALEDAECRRLYLIYLTKLQHAVSVGELKASPNKFSDNPKEYVCSFEDFLAWTKTVMPEVYAQYQAIQAKYDDGNHENNQVQQHTGINSMRNKDAAAWLEATRPDLNTMTISEIENALKGRDVKRGIKLWAKGFADWNRLQEVWPKKKPGRKSGK